MRGQAPSVITPEERELVQKFYFLAFRQWNTYPRRWCGIHVVKFPTDMFVYHMLIYRLKPDVVIETGSYLGGGALFFASMCDLAGHGEVLSVDRRELSNRPTHPRLTYIIGRSTAVDTLATIRERVHGRSCMVILDSDHRVSHVKRELVHYSPFVTKGQYLVVEDTFLDGHPIPWSLGTPGPADAVAWFMARTRSFVVDPLEDQFLISMCPGGWLRRL